MARVKTNMQRTPFSRVWLIEDGPAPNHTPAYQGLSRLTAVTFPKGDITPVRIPDPDRYGNFIVVDKVRGAPALPTTTLESRMKEELSDLLLITRKDCDFSLQLHVGKCQNPQDFNGGWDKIHVFERATATQYSTGELGAFDQSQDAVINETLAITAEDYYELKKLTPSELAAAEIVQEVVAVNICDTKQCGVCGIPSNGCQRFLAVTKSHGGSPGLPAEVEYSADAGATFGSSIISTLAANHDPSGAACVGTYYVVISNENDAIHYISTASLFAGTGTWTKVTTGIVGAGSPNAIFSVGASFTWIVGDGGYIYFSDSIIDGVVVQSAGAQTVQNLADIHGINEFFLVAVGASNAVVYTTDGGATWASITGPAVGVNLTAVYVLNENVWLIGTADGKLWYTANGGVSWTEKTFSGSGTGSVQDIQFSTDTVGYMAKQTSDTKGRIYRTIDGGHTWYILSETTGISIPDNDKVNSLAACGEDPNLVVGGGIGANAVDDFMVKFA